MRSHERTGPREADSSWSTANFEGNRRRQHEEFRTLPFREKLRRLEQMGDVAAHFAGRDQERRPQPGGERVSPKDGPERQIPPGP